MFAMYLSHLPSPYFQKVYSKKIAVQFPLLGMVLFFLVTLILSRNPLCGPLGLRIIIL